MAALTNDQILDAIASMSVLEASELVKAMEEKFGVTAAVAVAAAPGAAGGAAAGGDDEQSEFTVVLESFDAAKKIGVIKAVKALTNLGLGEAKALVEGAPATVKEGLSKADADKWVSEIEAAGGKCSKK
ncbi:50S ribosomal protein L7/L12 [Treponema sp.]|uniref:50S ribosomal protein L7/L12 n=1 Tax=Treponema sp. TaxID=166 RepID=UPI00298EA7B1|nr:50S ribosomal protein L7/L12 [Treponema sp.]